MKTTDKKTYLTPISKCTEIENTELICDSFNTDDPKEMEEGEPAGSKFRGFSFSFEQDE